MSMEGRGKISIKMSLVTYSALVLVLFIFVAVMVIGDLKVIEREVRDQQENNIAAILLAQEMRYSSAQVQQWYTDVSATRDPAGYEDVELHATNFRESLKKLSELDNSQADFNEVSADFETFYQTGRKMSEAYINQGTEEGNLIMEEFDVIAGDMVETSFNIVKREQDGLKDSYLNILTKSEDIKKGLLISLAAFLAILILAAVLVTKKIIPPLNEMTKGSSKFTEGDFRELIQLKSKDELGLLGDSLNQMALNIKHLIGEIMDASRNLDSKSQELAASSEEVGASTQQVASTTATLVLKTEGSVENAKETVNESEQVLLIAELGNKAVQNTLHKIDSISQYTMEAGKEIKELGELSSNISSITTVITDIAGQTNLLALNAAIEAARAGQQGQGFAVVAEEVRKLAEQSSRAAKEIGNLVKQIEGKIDSSIKLVERNIQEVNEGVNLASGAGEALDQIVHAVENIVKKVEHIAIFVHGAHESMAELGDANEQISATIEQVVVTTQELATMSGDLNEVINRFKV